MFKKLSVLLAVLCVLSAPALSADLKVKEVFDKIQLNQSKIKDMYAETKTIITSSFLKTGSNAPKEMVQTGKLWTKGKKKSKIEMLSPMKQVTITNEDKMEIVNVETGQKMIQDLKKMGKGMWHEQQETGMELEKAMEYFDLSAAKQGDDYVITGIPKKKNKMIGKMEFLIDGKRWIPVKITLYGIKNELISQSDLQYNEVSGVWVPVKNISMVSTPAGKMKMEMEYSNIKVNRGIEDKVFAID